MKVTVEDISTVKKIMRVEIPKKDVTRELDKAFKALKNNVKLKGFRPGKVPMALLEKKFSKEIQSEVSGQLIQESYKNALDESKLRPVGEPMLDRPDLEKGQSYTYSATLEVRPDIGELDFKGLSLTEKVYTVDDDAVEKQLEALRKRNAQLKTVDDKRPAKEKDVVIIDYEGFKDGKPLAAASKTENFQVELGSGRIFEEFDKQLVGMEVGSTKDVEVTFPEDYYNKDLANDEVTFKVTLKEIKEEILPDLDDEFAKDLGEYTTLDEVKEAIRENLEAQFKTETQRQLKSDIIDALIEKKDFEIPEVLLEEELAGMVRDAQSLMAQRGISMEDSGMTEEDLFEKYRPLADKKVREYLLLERLIEQEDLELTDEDLEEAYQNFADSMGEKVENIKQYYNSDPQAKEIFRQRLLEKRAIKLIKDHGDVKQVPAENESEEEAESNAE